MSSTFYRGGWPATDTGPYLAGWLFSWPMAMYICFHSADGSSHATGVEVTGYDKKPYDPYSPNNLWSDPLVSLLTFALDE